MAPPPVNLARFEEAIRWFRERVPMTDTQVQRLYARAREKAFWVSGLAELDVVKEIWTGIDGAVAEGVAFEAFRREHLPKLVQAWAGTVANPAARVETIFRTNVQLAYGAGRKAQMQDPAVKRAHPFWKFSSVLDLRTSEHCKPLNGTILPADDPFWQTHSPPLHHNCRSSLIGLTERAALRQGVAERAPEARAAEGFGTIEDAGKWRPNAREPPAPLRRVYRQKAKK
jgi:SPP1 gp7 family putative phage head morphogenesis protein